MEGANTDETDIFKRIIKIILWILGGISPIIIMAIIIFAGFFMISSSNGNSNGTNSSLVGVGVPEELIADFNYASGVSGIPNWVLAAICKHESSFNKDVVSSAGAYGLMQFRKLETNGASNWDYYMDKGLDKWFKEAGYSYSNNDEAWNIFLGDTKMQVLAGSFSLMEKGNYALKAVGIVDSIDPFNVENMSLFPWEADEEHPVLRESLRRLFAVYNYGQASGMTVDLDNADSNYPNRVYATAMEFRNNGLEGSVINSEGVIGKAIEIAKGLIGKTTYIYGGGRTQSDIDNGIFDCSSSIHYMYKQAGLELGPVSSATTFTLIQRGKQVNFDEMIAGDLIFFNTEGINTHMGMYIGNNQFIHCSSSKGVTIANLSSYWTSIFHGARRIVEGGN